MAIIKIVFILQTVKWNSGTRKILRLAQKSLARHLRQIPSQHTLMHERENMCFDDYENRLGKGCIYNEQAGNGET